MYLKMSHTHTHTVCRWMQRTAWKSQKINCYRLWAKSKTNDFQPVKWYLDRWACDICFFVKCNFSLKTCNCLNQIQICCSVQFENEDDKMFCLISLELCEIDGAFRAKRNGWHPNIHYFLFFFPLCRPPQMYEIKCILIQWFQWNWYF